MSSLSNVGYGLNYAVDVKQEFVWSKVMSMLMLHSNFSSLNFLLAMFQDADH